MKLTAPQFPRAASRYFPTGESRTIEYQGKGVELRAKYHGMSDEFAALLSQAGFRVEVSRGELLDAARNEWRYSVNYTVPEIDPATLAKATWRSFKGQNAHAEATYHVAKLVRAKHKILDVQYIGAHHDGIKVVSLAPASTMNAAAAAKDGFERR